MPQPGNNHLTSSSDLPLRGKKTFSLLITLFKIIASAGTFWTSEPGEEEEEWTIFLLAKNILAAFVKECQAKWVVEQIKDWVIGERWVKSFA